LAKNQRKTFEDSTLQHEKKTPKNTAGRTFPASDGLEVGNTAGRSTPYSKLAFVGLLSAVAGALALVLLMPLSLSPVFMLFAVVGLIVSMIAIPVTRDRHRRGRWIAITGAVISGATVLIVVGFIIWIIYSFVTFRPV
jgi:Flp pilus assembly protein TadB